MWLCSSNVLDSKNQPEWYWVEIKIQQNDFWIEMKLQQNDSWFKMVRVSGWVMPFSSNHVILTQTSFRCFASKNVLDRFVLPKRPGKVLTESMFYNSPRGSALLIRLIAFSRKTVSNKHEVYGTKIKENAHTCTFSENTSHVSLNNTRKWRKTRFFVDLYPICKFWFEFEKKI